MMEKAGATVRCMGFVLTLLAILAMDAGAQTATRQRLFDVTRSRAAFTWSSGGTATDLVLQRVDGRAPSVPRASVGFVGTLKDGTQEIHVARGTAGEGGYVPFAGPGARRFVILNGVVHPGQDLR
jgi:hypothetical protein